MMKSSICAWTLAGWAAIAIPDAAAGSVVGGYAPNYIFPDGTIGFHLGTSGGPIAPGVAIGFNPQPEPPGAPLPFLNLPSPSDLRVTQTCDGSVSHMCDGSVFRFELTFSGLPGLGAGELLPAVQMPNSDGVTAYRALLADGSVFVADLAFSGPPGAALFPGRPSIRNLTLPDISSLTMSGSPATQPSRFGSASMASR